MRLGNSLVVVVGLAGSALAGHREAPASAEDPALDSTDFYLFRSPTDDPDGKDTITIIANYWPFEDPSGGASGPRFATDTYYRILFDTDGDAKEDIVYQLTFETRYTAAKPSVLYARGPITSPTSDQLLVQQVARIERLETRGNKRSEQRDIVVAPLYTGAASYAAPGKTADQAYEEVARQAITPLTVKGGGKIFLGPRDDPYFADLGAFLDLLTVRTGGGIDYLAGYNVHTIALQIPISALVDGAISAHGKKSVIGAWTAGLRRKQITIGTDGKRAGAGYQQVSRLGLPLVNEWLVPLAMRDAYNAALPKDDAKTLAPLLQDPELAQLLKLGYKVPIKGRSDLVNLLAFNAGTAPLDVTGLVSADILRLDLSVPTGPLVPKTRLGVIGGDPAGFPNGRRLADDVVDIVERLVGGALCTRGKTCDVDPSTAALGDAVDQNDRPFTPRFPYVAAPWSGSAGTSLHARPAARP